jgi:hypothetical protein
VKWKSKISRNKMKKKSLKTEKNALILHRFVVES